jgi:hypothetical protein
MPARSVVALALVGVLVAAIIAAVVLLAPRHKVLAVGIVLVMLAGIGWLILILPAYWD